MRFKSVDDIRLFLLERGWGLTMSKAEELFRLICEVKGSSLNRLWTISLEDFVEDPLPGFQYEPKAHWEARVEFSDGKVVVYLGPKFFDLSPESRKWVIAHEFAHELESSLTPEEVNLLLDKVQKEEIFGPLAKDGTIALGPNGQYLPLECATETYAMMFDKEGDELLKKRWPKARRFVAELAAKKGFVLPKKVLKDYPDLKKFYKPHRGYSVLSLLAG